MCDSFLFVLCLFLIARPFIINSPSLRNLLNIKTIDITSMGWCSIELAFSHRIIILSNLLIYVILSCIFDRSIIFNVILSTGIHLSSAQITSYLVIPSQIAIFYYFHFVVYSQISLLKFINKCSIMNWLHSWLFEKMIKKIGKTRRKYINIYVANYM